MNDAKKAAAEKAATLVKDGMTVGLGTGSTAAYFIEALSKTGKKIQTVASSAGSHLLAQERGLALVDLNSLKSIDMYVDGADEIDPQKQMIKGAGGALLREKILAHMSREMVVVIDETKLVQKLGSRPLPVEIIPFGFFATLHHLHELGYRGEIRKAQDGSHYLTENSNYLYDIKLPASSLAQQAHERIISIPGVIETGFFPTQPGRVVIGFKDGSVVIH